MDLEKRHYVPGRIRHIITVAIRRKGIIDFDRLMGLLGFDNCDDLKDAHYKWMNSAMRTENRGQENRWTQSIAA
jgi:hypothetical protein